MPMEGLARISMARRRQVGQWHAGRSQNASPRDEFDAVMLKKKLSGQTWFLVSVIVASFAAVGYVVLIDVPWRGNRQRPARPSV